MTDFADIATTALADVQETFKRVYLMAVDAVPESTALSAQFQRTRKFKAAPDGLFFNAKLETGGSVANVGDGVLLPRPAHPRRKTGKASIVWTYTVVAVGGQSIPLTEDTRNAFVANLEDQMMDAMLRVRLDKERQDNGDGRGILCVVLTVAGAPTYAVEKPYGATGAGPGVMLLVEDMDVAFINPATGLERGRAKVVSINDAADQVTLSGAIAGAAIGDYVVRCNDVAAPSADKATNYLGESAGVMAAVKSGDTFENIPGTTYRRWNGVVMANGGTSRPISEKLISVLEAKILAKSMKRPTLHYTSRGLSIALQEQLAAKQVFTGERKKLQAGYEGVLIHGRTVIEGDYAAKGRWWALNTDPDVVGTMDLGKMGFVDLDGAKLHRMEGRHAFRADLAFPHNLLWFMRSAHGVLEDLEDDLTITR